MVRVSFIITKTAD